jgi:hypothetical protein
VRNWKGRGRIVDRDLTTHGNKPTTDIHASTLDFRNDRIRRSLSHHIQKSIADIQPSTTNLNTCGIGVSAKRRTAHCKQSIQIDIARNIQRLESGGCFPNAQLSVRIDGS